MCCMTSEAARFSPHPSILLTAVFYTECAYCFHEGSKTLQTCVYKTLLAVGTVCRKCKEIVQHTESLSGTFLDIGGMKVNYLLPVFHVVENITDKPCSQEKRNPRCREKLCFYE